MNIVETEEQQRIRAISEASNPYHPECPNRHLWPEGFRAGAQTVSDRTLIEVSSLEDLEHLLSWNISQNHTKKWGSIKGRYSCTYSFMHEDKNEVLKWLAKNYR
jgi:hypothetical protein